MNRWPDGRTYRGGFGDGPPRPTGRARIFAALATIATLALALWAYWH